jgi:hypothetical protein
MDQFSTLEYRLPSMNQGNPQSIEGRLAVILKQIVGVIDSDSPLTSVSNLFNMAPGNNIVNSLADPMAFLPMGNNNYTDFLGYDFSNGGTLSDTFGESPATGASSQSFDWSAFLGMFGIVQHTNDTRY